MTKIEIITWLGSFISAYNNLVEVSKLAPTDTTDVFGRKRTNTCNAVGVVGDAPLYDDTFDKVANALEATIIYKPNWSKRANGKNLGYAYFEHMGIHFYTVWEWG